MSFAESDSLILEAALEWGAEYTYEIKNGTMGMSLYIDALCKEDASYVRAKAPCFWHDLYVVVRYPTHLLTHADIAGENDPYADLYDPKLK